jgi:hypothetical protein
MQEVSLIAFLHCFKSMAADEGELYLLWVSFDPSQLHILQVIINQFCGSKSFFKHLVFAVNDAACIQKKEILKQYILNSNKQSNTTLMQYYIRFYYVCS